MSLMKFRRQSLRDELETAELAEEQRLQAIEAQKQKEAEVKQKVEDIKNKKVKSNETK